MHSWHLAHAKGVEPQSLTNRDRCTVATLPYVGIPNPKLIIRENRMMAIREIACSSCCGSDGDGSGVVADHAETSSLGFALFSTEPWPDWGTIPHDDKRFIHVYVSVRTGTRGILA